MKSIFSLVFLFSVQVFATEYQEHSFHGTGIEASFEQFIVNVLPGDIVVIGEKHGFYPHHQKQQEVITLLGTFGYPVSMGIEHIPYNMQSDIDEYIDQSINEEEFLKRINWLPGKYKSCQEYTEMGGLFDPLSRQPFDCYKDLFWLADAFYGKALGINLSRTVTNKIFKGGMDALTPEDYKLLPPHFEKGNALYLERFEKAIREGGHGHVTEELIEKAFWAQSLWDDTMAWQTMEYMKKHPDHVFVIVVGDFHLTYGGGLPDRLRIRGAQTVHTLSQDYGVGMSDSEIKEEAQPDPKYGQRANLTIIYSEAPANTAK